MSSCSVARVVSTNANLYFTTRATPVTKTDYDFKARFHWFRSTNMMVLMVIVASETSIRARPKDTPEEKGRVDLSRSMIQALAVATYLVLLCTVRPYVHSKLRRWKLWVTASNQGTSLLLILTRLLAEQAAATHGGVGGVDSTSGAAPSTTERPSIYTASLAFMYVL